MSQFLEIYPGETGVGYLVKLPPAQNYKLTRFYTTELGDEVVAEGSTDHDLWYYDLQVNPRADGVTHYKYYVDDVLINEAKMKPEPRFTWSANSDANIYQAHDPRDSLIVFLSARLAQLTKAGVIKVANPNHKTLFPVVRAYSFEELEAPQISALYSNGEGAGFDLGDVMNQENLTIDLSVVATKDSELQSVMKAIRGLQGEIRNILGMQGAMCAAWGGFSTNIVSVEPQMFEGKISIGVTCYSFNHLKPEEQGWTLLPWVPRVLKGSERLGVVFEGVLPPA